MVEVFDEDASITFDSNLSAFDLNRDTLWDSKRLLCFKFVFHIYIKLIIIIKNIDLFSKIYNLIWLSDDLKGF